MNKKTKYKSGGGGIDMKHEILRVICGSQAHGLAGPDSDYDYRGVFIVPTSEILALGNQKIHNTQWIEGSDDNTSWEIGHFLNLAIHGNPTILETFLAPIVDTGGLQNWYGIKLRELFPHVWNSNGVYNAFGGYAHNQQKKFLDKKDSRPHKYASTYLRVLYQGVQLLNTGTFPISFKETPIFETLLKWRNKEYTVGEVMDVTEYWKEEFRKAFEVNPEKLTNREPVNDFLLKVRKENWE